MKESLLNKSTIKKALLLFSLLSFWFSFAQSFLITFPDFNTAPTYNPRSITVCNSNAQLKVRLTAAVASTSGATATIQLPNGIEYVPGSVSVFGTNAGLTISDNGGTAQAPQFSIPGNIAAGNYIEFTITKIATCTARTETLNGTIFRDIVTASIGTNTATGTSPVYSVLYAVLNFTQPAAVNNAEINGVYTRTFSVINGGNGSVSSVYLTVTNTGVTTNTLTLTGGSGSTGTPVVLTPTSTVGTTAYYTIPSTNLSGGNLDNGENLTFSENFTVLSCTATTSYSVGWGCSSAPTSWCDTRGGEGTISMASGTPNYTVAASRRQNYVNACTPFNITYTITNTGVGSTKAASMYNVILDNQYPTDITANRRFDYLDFKVGTQSISPTYYGSNQAESGSYFDFSAIGLTSDPDGPGGLEDLDGDGVFDDIAPGSTVTIVVTLRLRETRTSYCEPMQTNITNIRPNLRVGYSTMCNSVVTYPRSGEDQGLIVVAGIDNTTTSMNNYTPGTVQAGVPFRTEFEVTSELPGIGNGFDQWPTSSTVRQWIHTFTLPAGVSVSGAGNITINGTAATASQVSIVGNVVTVTITGQSRPGRIGIDFVYTCGVGGSTSIPYTLDFIDDVTNSCNLNRQAYCYNFPMNVIGCNTCSYGPEVQVPVVRRDDDSYGFTDGTLTTRVPYTTIPEYQRKQALYGDVVRIDGTIIQKGAASNLFYRLNLNKTTSAPIQDKLTPLSAEVKVTRGGVLLSTTPLTTAVISTAESTATVSSFEWDLTSALPAGGLLDGDVVEVVSKYRVSSRNLPSTSFVNAPGSAYTFYNKDTAGNKSICIEIPIDLYLAVVSTGNSFENIGDQINGCGESRLVRVISYVTMNGAWPFSNEIRPFSYYNYIELTVPDSVVFVRTSSTGSASPVPGTQNSTHTPVITNNGNGTNTWRFTNDGSFVLNRGGNYSLIDVIGRPTCATPSNANYRVDAQIRDVYYAESVPYGTVAPSPSASTIYNYAIQPKVYANRPGLSLTNLSGSIQASRPTESFTVRLTSTGNSTASYVWIAVPTTPGVTVTQVVDLATNTPIAVVNYAGGAWAKVSDAGLATNVSRDYRIDFNFSVCTTTLFQVLAGWDCTGYPTDPTTYPCSVSTGNLTFTPVPGEVQVLSVTQPATPIAGLCSPLNYEFQVNSAGGGNLKDVKFGINQVTGATVLPSTIQAEYPAGAGNWAAVAYTTSGNQVLLDLTTHPAFPANGIAGTLNDGGNTNNRLIGVRFSITTDCTFVSGSNFTVTPYAKNSCGSDTTGNGAAVSTNSISIAGADPDYLVASQFTATPNFASCAPVTLPIRQTLITSTQTTSTGVVRIDLPVGFDFESTAITCSSADCPTVQGIYTDATTGTRYMILGIPAGLGSGTVLEYSVNVVQNASVCGENTIVIRGLDYVTGISCPTAPTGVCDTVTVQTGILNYSFTIDKPVYSIENITGSYNAGTYSGNITIENTSTLNSSAPIVVNFYCADAAGNPTTTLLGSATITTPITAGSQITSSYSFTGAATCASGKVYGVIELANNCACSPSNGVTFDLTSACYRPGATGGTVLETNHGISALGRAGTQNTDNWPMVRKGAWTVLEAKTKGFVVNRIPTTAQVESIANPVEGMMVYDEEVDCLKIYTTTDNGATFGWKCYNLQTCPE